MEPTEEKNLEAKRMKKFAFGIVVIVAGLLLLAFNTGALPYSLKHILLSWPMLLITIGIVSLFGSDSRVPGIILISIGGFFLLPRLDIFHFNVVHLFWPVILIVIGLLILFRKGIHYPHPHPQNPGQPGPSGETTRLDTGYINVDCIFSGSKQKIVNQDFKGGRISCVFGGVDLDLTQANLAEGTNTLEINVIFGGVNILVPNGWNIHLKNTSILGGFSDKRFGITQAPDPSRTLIVKASAVFGGGEIKSF
jgi:predicted membrane protein